MADFMLAGCSMRGHIATLIGKGGDAADRVARDATGVLLGAVMKAHEQLAHMQEQIKAVEAEGTCAFFTNAEQELSFHSTFEAEMQAEVWLDMIRLQIAKGSEQLQASLSDLHKVTKGYSEDTTSWKRELAADAPTKDIIAVAEKSILTTSPSQVQQKLGTANKD